MPRPLIRTLALLVMLLSPAAAAPAAPPDVAAPGPIRDAPPLTGGDDKVTGNGAQDEGDAATDEEAAAPEPFSTFTNSVGMEFVLLPAGTFTMGSPLDELGRTEHEIPHEVTLSQPFYMALTEVTQAQYEAVMGRNPSKYPGQRTPVQNVSHHDAVAFCEKLSEMEKRVYRLPTEAEWEYACRAGTTTPFAFGETISSDDVNFKATVVYGDGEKGVYRARPVAADGMTPNDWGIIGMHGNVQEWCGDWYDQDYYEKSPKVDPTGPATGRMKALRGGSYVTHPQYCRSAHRFGASPGHKFMSIGFRVVCEPRTDANEEAR